MTTLAASGPGSLDSAIRTAGPRIIVFEIGGDPITAGLVAGVEHPGNNLTGVSLNTGAMAPRLIELIREIKPNATQVALLVNPDNPTSGTRARVQAAVEAAEHVDLVIVVGSPRSSNSLRLVEVVKKLGHKPAYLVDNLEDLDLEWFRGANKVGVTSGASTPTQLTRRGIEYLEALEPPS